MTIEGTPEDRNQVRADGFSDAPCWPQRLRIGWCIAGVCVLVFATWSLVDSSANIRHEELVSTIGSLLYGAAMLLMGVICVRLGGIRHVLYSPRIRSYRHPEYGTGIVVPGGLTPLTIFMVLLVVVGLGCLAVAALNIYITDKSELPYGRDPHATAIFMIVGGVVALIASAVFVWFRLPTTVGLYPQGIERVVRSRKLRRNKATVQFVRWDAIEGIIGTDIVTRSGSGDVRTPMIHIHTTGRIPPEARIPHDEEHTLAIVCTWLIAEPNALLVLARRMHERPHDRTLLAREDAAELLRPPPLRERFRMARHQEASR
ncbi:MULTISPECIES: hypothetical protein [Rhodococcus]|uniref:PH domain-containing protein n=1 Tax=Rhodococcus rhodochrous TaxID=1829 RepID=A0AAW4XET2_RHORH|nr:MULTISPECIES: hypothetical protein [Rhodococcus]MCD2111635.1 hypothetical protein [Rhodococcus rhodochrous]WAL46012.1 hypothetical protein OQN32_21605 [Rhodococcus pyridinivorans]